jgi:hypothetical protein
MKKNAKKIRMQWTNMNSSSKMNSLGCALRRPQKEERRVGICQNEAITEDSQRIGTLNLANSDECNSLRLLQLKPVENRPRSNRIRVDHRPRRPPVLEEKAGRIGQ